MKPLITVVVAVYNAEKYLNKCVDSLLNQTYTNIEIILVNDCSEDNSLNICLEYIHKYDNVILINNQSNVGVSATRNNGIERARGKYICFVDSDDFVESQYIELLFNELIKNKVFLSICGSRFIDYTNNCERYYLWNKEKFSEKKSLAYAFDFSQKLYLNALWNKLFVLELIEKQNIRFDVDLSMGEDTKFTLDYIEKNNITEVVLISKPLYNYIRRNTASLMNNYFYKIEADYSANLRQIYRIVKPLNNNADVLYEQALTNLKQNLKYSVVQSKKSIREKLYLIRLLYPEYSIKNYCFDVANKIKEDISNFLHR